MKFTRSSIFNPFTVVTLHEIRLIGKLAVAFIYTQFSKRKKNSVVQICFKVRWVRVHSRPFATFEYRQTFTIADRRLRAKAVFGTEVNCPIKLTINLQSYDLITFS